MKYFDLPICNNPLKTREDVQNAVKQLCDPLKPHYSEGSAQLFLGGSGAHYYELSSLMEAFARPLWGLAPLAAGKGEYDIWDIYIEGIRNGTNPEHPEYWGKTKSFDQRFVEMAAIGLALSLVPDKIWNPLNESEKKNFYEWLNQINVNDLNDNNWLFFNVLVNVGLKKINVNYNKEAMNKALNRLDEFYISDGWYSDGATEQRDYYIPFAMHFYSLVYAKLMENEDPVRSNKFKERAKKFAEDFIYWFSEDGSALAFGRSLTYRFAQSAFWGALAFAGVEVFSWGVMKGIILRNLRWWFAQPIFSTDGILTIGYAYPNLVMSEGYNAPGSPYWSMKAFLPLSLSEEHPFWKAKEEELPKLKNVSVQKHPHMILCRDKQHIFALTSGQYAAWGPTHGEAKYEKFAYSNIFGFSVSKSNNGLSEGAYDSMMALSDGDNIYRVRQKCEEYHIDGNVIYSRWKPWKDVEVETWLVPAVPWHVRVHRINTKRELIGAEGGFAIRREGFDNNSFIYEGDIINNKVSVLAGFNWGASGIVNLYGERKAELVTAQPNTNLICPRTVIPTLKGSLMPGTHIIAAAVVGILDKNEYEKVWNNPPTLQFESGNLRIEYKNDNEGSYTSCIINLAK